MLETILILNMDSHFHGNDRHKKQNPVKTIDKTDTGCQSHKTDEVCCFLVCHSRVFNILSSSAAYARVFLSGGNPRLLKNSFYISSLKEIMLETILILNMDSHF
ncbi:MAG: hypothetical protein LBQ47_07760, partial [Endomicrobium sp.]|nr:hypothetical protein [Endomicrobium sp.]